MNKAYPHDPKTMAAPPESNLLAPSQESAPESLRNRTSGLRLLDHDNDSGKIQSSFQSPSRIAASIKSAIVYAACNGWIPMRLADWIIQKGGFSYV